MKEERKKDSAVFLKKERNEKDAATAQKQSAAEDMIKTAARIILGERGEKAPEKRGERKSFFAPFLLGCLFSALIFCAAVLAILL